MLLEHSGETRGAHMGRKLPNQQMEQTQYVASRALMC